MVETSLRHTPSEGKIALSARTGSGVEIAVSTTGRPLAPEEKAQLLGETSQSTPKLPSGGLALYFCRRAVEAHDGDFDIVESESAGGPSSVVMRLPATG
jgi:signal transduction histidine kinase